MLEYLEKFNNLPAGIKQKISSGEVMAEIEELEKKYGLELASFVMRIMVGDLYYKNITANLIIEFNLEPEKAVELEKELKEKVFAGVKDYLEGGKSSRAPAPKPLESPFFVKRNPAPSVRQAPVEPQAAENFFKEDEKDIAAMGKMAASLKPGSVARPAGILDEVIKESNVSFSSESLAKRFRDILATYLRGVRTKAEVREKLLETVAGGGVMLEAASADRVLNIAQKKLAAEEKMIAPASGKVSAKTSGNGTNFIFNEEEIKRALRERKEPVSAAPGLSLKPSGAIAASGEREKARTAGSGMIGARDLDYDFSALNKRGPISAARAIKAAEAAPGKAPAAASLSGRNLAESAEKSALPSLIFPAPINNSEPILPTADSKNKEADFPPVPEYRQEKTRRTAAPAGNKIIMEDIKSSPRVMSPVDELAYLDLVNFRRLDADPAGRIAKIEKKIALLEKEGIDKKIEGIKAWRSNPVNKTYLSMGHDSISGGKSIDDIINERKSQGLNYLSREEFDAVMDLNDYLRF
jgi:hypothetical protein